MNWKTSFIKKIGLPYYQNDKVLLYNCDSLEYLQKISENSINLTVTSPPYNIGKEYEKIMDIEDYIEWSTKWLSYIPKILSKNGAFWLNLGYVKYKNTAKALPLVYLLWNRIELFLIQEIVWNYGAGVAAKTFLSPRNEKWLWFVKDEENYTFNLDKIRDPNVLYPNSKKNGRLRCNTIGKNPSDVWQIAKVTSGMNRSSPERTTHPAQFPLDLINRIIMGFSNENEVVFDPFMGSGSTAISCVSNNRNVIGFEINKNYCEIQIDRIEKYYENKKNMELQKELFAVNS